MECNDHVVAPRCGDAQRILINLLKPMECNDHVVAPWCGDAQWILINLS